MKLLFTVMLVCCGLMMLNAQTESDIVPSYFMDDLKDNSNDWLLGGGNGWQTSIKQNHVEISNGSLGAIQTFTEKIKFPKSQKYGIETRYIITQSYKSATVSLRCGMANRGKDFISFTIDEDVGKYKISAFGGKKGKEKVLAKWKPVSFLNKRGYNVLTIERDGDSATFRLNGIVLKVLTGISKYWLGDLVTVKAGASVTAMFDAVAVYGYHKLTDMERTKFSPLLQKQNDAESFARDFAQWADAVQSENQIPFDEQVTNANVKSFFINFQPMELPYRFNYESSQGRDITSFLPRASGKVYALGEVATCSDRKVVLVMRRYQSKGQGQYYFLSILEFGSLITEINY